MITRRTTIEFQHGTIGTLLEIEQIADIVDGHTVDKINQLVTASVTRNAVPGLGTFIGSLDLSAAPEHSASATMALSVNGLAVTFTVSCTIAADIDDRVVEAILVKEIMPNVASEILSQFGTQAFGTASVEAGYMELLQQKMMEKMFGGMPDVGPMPGTGIPADYMTMDMGGEPSGGGMYL